MATSLFGPIPTEASRWSCSRIARTRPLIRATGSGTVGEVEVDLVERSRLGRHAELGDDRHHLARALAVVGHVDRQVDEVGAAAPRVGDRHRRADPERPRLIGGRGDHRARPAAGDDHRLAAQLRAAQELDRDVEGVHVEVGDRPAFLHRSIVGRRPASLAVVALLRFLRLTLNSAVAGLASALPAASVAATLNVCDPFLTDAVNGLLHGLRRSVERAGEGRARLRGDEADRAPWRTSSSS